MGIEAHRAMIVTGWDEEKVELERQRAVHKFQDQVSNLIPAQANGWWSFLIGTSGSKVGWERWNRHCEQLEAFAKGCKLQWTIVQYASELGDNFQINS